MNEPQKRKSPSSLGAAWLAGVGFELAGAVGGLCLLGYWIDRKFDTSPWFLISGAIIGIVGGLYNVVRKSLLASIAERDRRKKDDDSTQDGIDA